jgi:hypothetical protein
MDAEPVDDPMTADDQDELAVLADWAAMDSDEEAVGDYFPRPDLDVPAVSVVHQDSVWAAVGGCCSLLQEVRADSLPAGRRQALDASAESEGSAEPPRSQ